MQKKPKDQSLYGKDNASMQRSYYDTDKHWITNRPDNGNNCNLFCKKSFIFD